MGTVLASFTILFSALIYNGLALARQMVNYNLMFQTYLIVTVEATFLSVILYISYWVFERALRPMMVDLPLGPTPGQ